MNTFGIDMEAQQAIIPVELNSPPPLPVTGTVPDVITVGKAIGHAHLKGNMLCSGQATPAQLANASVYADRMKEAYRLNQEGPSNNAAASFDALGNYIDLVNFAMIY